MNPFQKKIKKAFRIKDYRHGYVDEFLNTYIATQIKVLREQQGWTQIELAEQVGMKQSRISVLENVNYSSWSINVLRKLAEAFDLTLCVSFEEFGKRVKDVEMFSREYLERNSFNEDPYFELTKEDIIPVEQDLYSPGDTQEASAKVTSMKDYLTRKAGSHPPKINISVGSDTTFCASN